ncbi:MAG: branched-chain amino acid ABC transporter permease [Pseudomonadota bacterium]|jgi:branched-chain amino acid transport system permease protein|nr:branched-chain amino acid ABC transporter permease [Rhodospirillaceae bacterium]MCH2630407.1 branched-chain amino acid ABC transporter permease [Nisaea sp.]MEC7973120.1 branched-chain amino acid ABC transporter permease [Pseudomonadota bacterium]MEC9045656.1 branched-chain amino acid ABC transporter permease [Pseudomonadota bacterium]|tara:strand:+ start:1003 stop:1950 length:948 start_codon:yes stop_codon:yes gene_type:complete
MSWNISRGVLITCLVLFGLLVFVPLTGSKYLIDLSTEIMVYALFALSLNVIIGFSGNVSFGHAAYFAIGGYANAILLTTYGWPLIFAFPAAIILSALAAAFVAYFCTRLTDIYFAMLTLAFSMLVWAIAFKWRSVTGGDDGFVGVTVPSFIDGRVPFFYFTLIIVTASIIILWLICHSAFGQTLIAVRENLTRAGFIGVNTRMMRGIAFVIAGAFAGVAGAIFAMYNRGVYTESAFWAESAQVLIMTLLGGMYSFFGPAIGAATLYILERFANEYTEYWPTVLGLILLVIVLVLPEGLVGLAKRLKERLFLGGGQ